jgi:hypothetical protein
VVSRKWKLQSARCSQKLGFGNTVFVRVMAGFGESKIILMLALCRVVVVKHAVTKVVTR